MGRGFMFVPRSLRTRWDAASWAHGFMFDRPCAAHTMGRAQGCVLAPISSLVRFASLHGLTVQPISCRFAGMTRKQTPISGQGEPFRL